MKKQLQYMSCSQLTNEPWKSCQLGSIKLHSLSLSVCRATRKPVQYQLPSQDVQVHVEMSYVFLKWLWTLACQIQRCNKFRLDNPSAVQYGMLLLSRSTEGGGKEGRSARSLVMWLQIWSIMKLIMKRTKGWDCLFPMDIHIAAQSCLRREANSLHLSISKGLWKRGKSNWPENLIKI